MTTPNPGRADEPAPGLPVEHLLRYSRFQKGKNATRPTRPVYGTSGRCSCGWRGKDNLAPSKGGVSGLRSLHKYETGEKAEVIR